MTHLKLLLIVALVGLIGACSSATHNKIKTENLSDNWNKQPRQHLLLLALYEDNAERISIESVIAEELKGKGLNATASFQVVPDLSAIKTDSDAHTALKGHNFDGVLTISTLSSQDHYEPGNWYADYGLLRILGANQTEARALSNTKDLADYYGDGQSVLDITLHNRNDFTLIWQATTDSYSKERGAAPTKALASFLFNALSKRHLIKTTQ